MTNVTLRNLIIALVLFFGVVGTVTFGFVQIMTNSSTLEQQIAAVAAQSEQEQELLRLQRLATNSQADRAELATYFLLRESDSISFLSQIETLAPTIGIELQTVGLEQVVQEQRNWIEVDFLASGSRLDVQNFIQILEIIPYVSRVTSVNLKETTGSTWQANITIQVQLLTYDK